MKTIALFTLVLMATTLEASPVDVYFGTAGSDSKGLYRAQLDPDKGKLHNIQLAAEIANSGFLAFPPDRKQLYVAGQHKGEPAVVAYTIEEDGSLAFLNAAPIGDGGAAHLAVHPSGEFLVTAQYGGGSVAIFPRGPDGRVAPRARLIEHKGGAGDVPERMEAPHPHWVGFSPDERFAFVPDLGMNAVVTYKVVGSPDFLEPAGSVSSVFGGGPRHMKFSIDGQFIYLLNELSLSVTTFAYDAKTGAMTQRSTTPALSEAVKARESFNSASEILVHPSGRFVYSANRGHDSVTAYRADPATGELEVIEVEPIRGSWPRNINMDASGRWLLAAGAHSNTLSVFAIDPKTGELQFPQRGVYNVPGCICILLND